MKSYEGKLRRTLLSITLLILISITNCLFDDDDISIQGLEPNGGLTKGETRVLVRLKNFKKELIDTYPHPKCRFGAIDFTVDATFTKCTPKPRKVGEKEAETSKKTEICIQCENSPKHEDDIVPFTISLVGDFTDTYNSIPYRFYEEPEITWINPRYGLKDGDTVVDVYGKNFLNFDQNLRCGFGTTEVKGIFISETHIRCISPFSSVVQQAVPFTISLNNQQNTDEFIPYVYYEKPSVYRIEPSNRGPDCGGTVIRLRGSNFNPLKDLKRINNANETFCEFSTLGKVKAKVISSTELECVTPPSYDLTQTPVEITLNNQQWTDNDVLFYYYHPPYTYYISPKIGPISGGTVVNVWGGNFEDTGIVKCKFGDKLGEGKYISDNQLECISPAVETACIVPLRVATREDEYSSGLNTRYTYYADPIIHFIEPICGPESGYTQITVYGENFLVGYSNNVKCLFNGEIKTNATIMDSNVLKCDSPALPSGPGFEEKTISEYNLTLLVNDQYESGPGQMFYYYKSPVISGISPILGRVEGDTTVKINGNGFNQPGACNITARFATYHTKPLVVNNNYLIVKSPEANYTGSVVVQVALNGQQFEKDITVNFRDQQNTFYYYKCPIIVNINPSEGPSAGGNDISLYGIGFQEPFFALSKKNNLKSALYEGKIEKMVYYRFVDYQKKNIIYGDIQSISIEEGTTQKITLKSPSILKSENYRGRDHIKTVIQLSYDGETFCDYDIVYTFFNLPNIQGLNPKFAPLITKDKTTVLTLDNLNCTESDCSKGIKCRFTTIDQDPRRQKIFFTDGKYLEKNKVKCDTPNINIPEAFVVEFSINGGNDFTNNGLTFTYYDPFVLKVEPQMLSDKGNTGITITGYGFADTGDNVKALFGDSELKNVKCGQNSLCQTPADFINSTTIKTVSKPRSELKDSKTGKTVENYEKIPVEVAIYNDDFTDNKVSVFYYQEPTIVNDIFSKEGDVLQLDKKEKNELNEALVKSIPCNIDTFIPIPVDGSEIEEHLAEIQDFTNYTCLFEINDKKKVTNGVYTKFPLTNKVHNLFLCQSPEFVNEVGTAEIKISMNGYDYSDDHYQLELTDPVNVYKVSPACGPIEGGTEVKIYGTGFQDDKHSVFKWGPQNLVPMSSKSSFDPVNEQTSQEVLYGMKQFAALNNPDDDAGRDELLQSLEEVDISKIVVTAPPAPNDNVLYKTRGGLDYIAVSKSNLLPLDDFLQKYYANNYIHTNFEYYYYRQLYIESYYPSGSVSNGGAKIMVIGAWFQYKPEYGLRPYCKFGDKVVEAVYLSTVRIVCEAPPIEQEYLKVPFFVSLNGEDWVQAEKDFRYYGDFKNAKFESIVPTSGPTTGGTKVRIYGSGFTANFDENEFMCQFEPVTTEEVVNENGEKEYKEVKSEIMEPRTVPAQLFVSSTDKSDESDEEEITGEGTYIECNTPEGWSAGSKTNVKIAFDGVTYLDTGKDFYFFKINQIVPCSGPNSGHGDLSFIGGGFQKDSNITFVLDEVSYQPIEVTEQKIVCDIPEMPNNFTGYVDMSIFLNGVDEIKYPEGFYYYHQPRVSSVFPKTGPSSGKAIFHVYGQGFHDDFTCANVTCKIGNSYGQGEIISSQEVKCIFPSLPVEQTEYTEKEEGEVVKSGNPISVALNGVSFTEENDDLNIFTYSLEEISPVSGPIESGTTIIVKGTGFTETDTIRCRFGVPGYFAYTEASYIDYNKITCPSPTGFELPNGGQLPFTVPFSIAFNDEEFNPWTETSHVFTFYQTPEIAVVTPNEVNTLSTVPVFLKSDEEEQKFFSIPSASVREEEYQILNKKGEPIRGVRKSFKYQPITCKFGQYGVTEADYVNRTDINCLTPNFADDEDIVYEEIGIEVAPNGVDYIEAGNINLKGQQAKTVGCMYCVLAVLGILFLAALAALVAWMCSKNMIGMGDLEEKPHTEKKRLRYIPQEKEGTPNL